MKVFKATLSIDMSITTFIISTLCQNRKGEDTGYDHQHLKDNLQKHDDNSPGCYQKYKESQRWQSGKSPKDDGKKSNNIHENPCNILRISAKIDKNILRISAK